MVSIWQFERRKNSNMELYIYGAGGNGKELFHILRKQGELKRFTRLFFIDKEKQGGELYGCPICGIEDVLKRQDKEEFQVIISQGEPQLRLELLEILRENKIRMYSNVEDELYYKKLGEGVADWGCNVLAEATVGDACLLGTNAVIGHDAIIGEGTHIGCNAFVGGGCIIGKGVLIGPGAVIRHNVKIGDNTSIGMGSIVLKNVPANSLVMDPSSKLVLNGRTIVNFKE